MNAAPAKVFSGIDFYRALFDNPKKNAVLLLDHTGVILETNRAFLLSFGYDAEDVIGKDFSMLFSEADRKKDLPMREVSMVLDEGQSFDNNYLVNKNGVLTWVSGESVLITNTPGGQKYILKMIQNIHIQKESEHAIIRLNTFNEDILKGIEDAVIVLNNGLGILKANRSFLRLFALTEEQLSAMDFRHFMRSFDGNDGLYTTIIATLESRSCPPKMQVDLEDAEGNKKSYDVSCARLDEQEEGESRVLLIFHDVTAQKSFERQREDILNFVAHELRNPLTNVILNVELTEQLLNEGKGSEVAGFIDRARINAQRLKKLINELYKSTRLISGNFDLESTVFEFEAMIDESIEALSQIHSHRRITRKGEVGVQVLGDRDKLIQVVTNYLTNAIKYSDDDRPIEITISATDQSITVAVTDHGKGIPVKDQPFIFNRFFRAEKTKNLEGLGIGLFLSRQIIEAHQGRTWVESVEGEGSTFYFSVPLHVVEG